MYADDGHQTRPGWLLTTGLNCMQVTSLSAARWVLLLAVARTLQLSPQPNVLHSVAIQYLTLEVNKSVRNSAQSLQGVHPIHTMRDLHTPIRGPVFYLTRIANSTRRLLTGKVRHNALGMVHSFAATLWVDICA